MSKCSLSLDLTLENYASRKPSVPITFASIAKWDGEFKLQFGRFEYEDRGEALGFALELFDFFYRVFDDGSSDKNLRFRFEPFLFLRAHGDGFCFSDLPIEDCSSPNSIGDFVTKLELLKFSFKCCEILISLNLDREIFEWIVYRPWYSE